MEREEEHSVTQLLEENNNRFVLLCNKERYGVYRSVLDSPDWDIEVVGSIENLLEGCLSSRPRGVLIDIPSSLSLKTYNLSLIYELNVHWPIMRCNSSPDGEVMIMCYDPYKSEPLINALRGIVGNDSSWRCTRSRRKSIRIDINCRVRVGRKDSWVRGNARDLSTHGIFIITYDPPEKGERVTLEIMDVLNQPMAIDGEVVWVKTWDESVHLPGMGISFEQGSLAPIIRNAVNGFTSAHFLDKVHRKNCK